MSTANALGAPVSAIDAEVAPVTTTANAIGAPKSANDAEVAPAAMANDVMVAPGTTANDVIVNDAGVAPVTTTANADPWIARHRALEVTKHEPPKDARLTHDNWAFFETRFIA